MAGAGYKLFNTGDVLTAAQVNTYLNEQTVMVFASSAARTTALSGVLAEGMMSYLQDTNAVEVYNGTAWVSVGGGGGDVTEVQAGVGISVASGTGPIPIVTNSSTDLITTAGDLLYGTAADTVARLGIGTAGQVLKVNSGATAPEWGTAAAGALTKIATTSFSNVASQTFDNLTTYNNWLIILSNMRAATSADDLQFRFRFNSVTATASGYLGMTYGYSNGTANNVAYQASGAVQATISTSTGDNVYQRGNGYIFISKQDGVVPQGVGMYVTEAGFTTHSFAFAYDNQGGSDVNGFLLKSASTNITGTVTIYGYEV
jgi:hypothetical protein